MLFSTKAGSRPASKKDLLKRLGRHGETDRVESALDEMADQSAESVLPLLIECLCWTEGESPYEVRARAAGTIGRLGTAGRQAFPDLVRALDDSDVSVVVAAAKAIASVMPAPDEAVRALAAALSGRDHWFIQKELALDIGMFGTHAAAALDALKSLLRPNTPPDVLTNAVSTIGVIGPPARDLIPTLKSLPDGIESREVARTVRDRVITAIKLIEGQASLRDWLVRVLADAGLSALSQDGTPRDAELVLYFDTSLLDRDPAERERFTIWTAGHFLDAWPELIEMFGAALQQGESDIRELAAVSLAYVTSDKKAALRALKPMKTREKEPSVLRRIEESIGILSQVAEPLVEIKPPPPPPPSAPPVQKPAAPEKEVSAAEPTAPIAPPQPVARIVEPLVETKPSPKAPPPPPTPPVQKPAPPEKEVSPTTTDVAIAPPQPMAKEPVEKIVLEFTERPVTKREERPRTGTARKPELGVPFSAPPGPAANAPAPQTRPRTATSSPPVGIPCGPDGEPIRSRHATAPQPAAPAPAEPPPEIKFACPKCGQHFSAERDMIGERIHCPVCKTIVPVPSHSTR